MKSNEEAMEILEAFDLVQSYEAAAKLASCNPRTVKHYVQVRDRAGELLGDPRRERMIDSYMDKIEQWVELSKGKIRADVAHLKLKDMGFEGSERTTRRAVAEAKDAYAKGHRRIYRPWIPEPGMWFQFDWGDGPDVAGRRTSLWCAWLAWSRFRVVIPTWDRKLPTVIACIDETLRHFGGVPTYALTDNEKTVTVDRVATIPVRHPTIVAAGRHYGISVRTCQPHDPESKGGVEATVKIAKADLVPTDANLLPSYETFDDLKQACTSFMTKVNDRPHAETRRVPSEMIVEERARLHAIPPEPYAHAFGETRRVDENDSTIRFGSARYSVPSHLAGEWVWVSVRGDELVCVHQSGKGAAEVARHKLTTPGNPSIDDAHYPERTTDPLNPKPRPTNKDEVRFLSIGGGAEQWLIEAAACGAERVRSKMKRAIELKSLFDVNVVDRALGRAAASARFDDGDLESILDHLRMEDHAALVVSTAIADEASNLQQGTDVWQGFGG